MDIETKEYLRCLYVYLNIMNNINKSLNKIIKVNQNNNPDKTVDLFYLLTSEILRILPYKVFDIQEKEKTNQNVIKEEIINDCLDDDSISLEQKNKKIVINKNDGILLLRRRLDYIEEEYNKLILNESLKDVLINILKVRNKFTHEPHNLSVAFSVGCNTSCSMGIYYKDELEMLSTIDIQVIVKKLNLIFIRIRKEFINIVKMHDKDFKQYPIYKKVVSFKFEKYNEMITILPKYF